MCCFKSGVSGAPHTISVSLPETPVDADMCLVGDRNDLSFESCCPILLFFFFLQFLFYFKPAHLHFCCSVARTHLFLSPLTFHNYAFIPLAMQCRTES